MKDSKLAEGGLGKKRDIRLAKRFIKDLQGIDTPAAKEFKALMNEVLAGGYKPVKKKDGGLAEAIEKVKAKEMKVGGEAVPPKFKGFSKLPESVQQKMNPELAEKFGMGGDVKAKKSGNICRGRGIARPGTGFTIR